MFDRVILLTRGGVFFDAPPALTIPYFASFGHDVPEGVNPADHYIQIADAFEKTEEAEQRVRGLLAHWKTSEAQDLMANLKAEHANKPAQEQQSASSANFSRPDFGLKARKISSRSRQLSALPADKRERSFEEWPSLWGYELLVLAHRDFLLQIRNPAILFGTIGQTVVLLILIGFSFFRVSQGLLKIHSLSL
jgi:ABC-2 type transporter